MMLSIPEASILVVSLWLIRIWWSPMEFVASLPSMSWFLTVVTPYNGFWAFKETSRLTPITYYLSIIVGFSFFSTCIDRNHCWAFFWLWFKHNYPPTFFHLDDRYGLVHSWQLFFSKNLDYKSNSTLRPTKNQTILSLSTNLWSMSASSLHFICILG